MLVILAYPIGIGLFSLWPSLLLKVSSVALQAILKITLSGDRVVNLFRSIQHILNSYNRANVGVAVYAASTVRQHLFEQSLLQS